MIVKPAISDKAGRQRMNTSQIKLLGILLIIVALVLGVTGARHRNQPAQFHAMATVKVERDKIDRTELGEIVPAAVDSTFFIQTEIELMQSEAPLSEVIEKLNLNQAWGKKPVCCVLMTVV